MSIFVCQYSLIFIEHVLNLYFCFCFTVYNWCEIKTKMWVMNLGKTSKVPQLNEAMAIELGANMLGETIVFSIAAGILFFEYSRQVGWILLNGRKNCRTDQTDLCLFVIRLLRNMPRRKLVKKN